MFIGEEGNIQLDTERALVGLVKYDTTSEDRLIVSSTMRITAIAVRPNDTTYVNAMYNQIAQSDMGFIEYLVYSIDVNQNSQKPNYGLVVYDQNGDMTYSSENKYLKITEIVDIPMNYLDYAHALVGPPFLVSHNTINPFFIIPKHRTMWPYPSSQPGIYGINAFMIGVKKCSSTSTYVGFFHVFSTPPLSDDIEPVWIIPNPFRIALCVP